MRRRYLWPAPTSQLFLPGPVGLDAADSSMEEEGPAAAAADLRARARWVRKPGQPGAGVPWREPVLARCVV